MKAFLKKGKDWLYRRLVESDDDVMRRHQEIMSEDKREGRYSPAKSALCLLKLLFLIRVLKLRKYKRQSGRPYSKGSESELSYKGTPQEYAEKLLKYDVVSFDVFDTLIFRPFQNPEDLFYIVGEKLEYMDFANIRAQSERKLRAERLEKELPEEINIYEIYEYMQRYCGVPAKEGAECEYETELALACPNPFMKQVYDILVRHGKKIIAVSDMYMTGEMVGNILRKCGYGGVSGIFVSSGYGCGKHDGKLFGEAKKITGENFRYVHIGDNWRSDFENPVKYGFDSLYYENVNHKGGWYRPYDMSAIVGSAYRGIVNAHLHNGSGKYSAPYEYGFACGGIFVLGYCSFIRRYAQGEGIDKILFLSRDGEILKKVYDKMYPGNNSEYAYWSRNAAAKLGACKFRHDYFRRFVHHKTNAGIAVEQAFRAMGTESLLPEFENDGRVGRTAELTPGNADILIKWLSLNWRKVEEIYGNENEAAKKYYTRVAGGCKRLCTVDIGWAGSGGTVLSYLVKDVWKLDCEMFTVVAGTNSARNAEPNTSEGFLQSGKMAAYLYSQSHNRHFYHSHDPGAMHNVFLEMLLSSKTAGLKGFWKTGGEKGYELVFADCGHENDAFIDEIHKGISDFADIYLRSFQNCGYMLNISGNDAYVPFRHLVSDDNAYFKMLFKNLYFEIGVGEETAKKIF